MFGDNSAGWMGKATEHLSEHLGQGIGGLLNSTFGNAAELIIALFALSKGLEGVAKASTTGSIVGNPLLYLGLSIIAGGSKFKQQFFNRIATSTAAIALTLAVVALLIPTIFHEVDDNVAVVIGGWTPAKEQTLSLAIAIVLFVAPILVFACCLFGKPMNLEFTIPEVVAVIASVLIAQQISSDGERNWIEGMQLPALNAILGILFFFLPDVPHAAADLPANAITPAH